MASPEERAALLVRLAERLHDALDPLQELQELVDILERERAERRRLEAELASERAARQQLEHRLQPAPRQALLGVLMGRAAQLGPAQPRPRAAPRPHPAPQPAAQQALPRLRSLEARLRYLHGRRPGVSALHELVRFDENGIKPATLARLARAYMVRPRWLALGEDAQGEDWEGFGWRLRQAREERGLSGRELGRCAGVSESMVAMLQPIEGRPERRVVYPSLATVIALASALGCSPGWLAYGGPP